MKFIKTFALGAVVASGALFAVLPPEAQTAKEISSIEQNEEYMKFAELEPGKVPTIVKVDGGYVVELEHHKMNVHVHYLPPVKEKCCGPAVYELAFDAPETIEQAQ